MKRSKSSNEVPRCRLPSRRRASSAAAADAVANDDVRWQSVVARDKSCDGAFVYAVSTTGIYCRPGCPSRLAERRNVTFYDDGPAAEESGFRPCKRCKPHELGRSADLSLVIADVCRMIEASEQMPALDDLAKHAGFSRFHFHRVFKEFTGITPKAYALAHRAAKLKDHLQNAATITGAIYDAGYPSSGRFYSDSAARLGMTPRSYRAGGAGAVLQVACAKCSLGVVLVAASPNGICAILIGDDDATLLRDVRKRFPNADFADHDASLQKLVQQVVTLIERPGAAHHLPLDVQGTAFQQQVWAALQTIRPGTTTTYSDLAQRIGKPSAVRAVAGACAANPVAVAVPCHRVVKTDGSLSGYRWGVERKRELLAREENNSRRKR